ncbi:MAG: sulfite exporter TauE/SafE family protein [Gemmatimonadales bacterium]
MFPASVLFSTIAIGSGVSGALFFSPFFMLVVGLSPAQAVGAGLLTEVFGMGNGLRSYVKAKLVDYATAKWLLLGAVPTVVIGAIAADLISDRILKAIFGLGLLALSGFLVFVRTPEECEPGEKPLAFIDRKSQDKGTTVVRGADGSVYEYRTCWRPPGVLMAAAGGLLTGMISAGLPEISTTQLVVRCRVPPRVAVATSVFTLAIVAAAGAGIHALAAKPVWQVVGWSIPGVLLGSGLGSRIGKYMPAKTMEKALGVVFGAVGALVLALEFLI